MPTVDSILYFWEQYNRRRQELEFKRQIEAEERAWLASEFHKPKLESPNPILVGVPVQAKDSQVETFLRNLKTRALVDAGYFDNDYTDDREIHIDLE